MIAAVAPIAALLLSVALLLTGNGLQNTLLPVRGNIEGFSAFEIGIVGSMYFLGFAAGCLYGPRIVRRAGHIRTFTAMVAIASAVVLVHALIIDPLTWWLLRMVTGFCFAVLYTVVESWLNERSTNENRGLVFSIYTIISLTVITVGQLMLMLDDPTDFPLFMLASITVSLAAVPIALTRSHAPAPIQTASIRLRYLFDRSPVGMVGCFTVGMANGAFWALGPVFAQSGLEDTSGVALFMSLAVIGGAIGQWPLGRLSDTTDRRRVIILACIGAATAGTALAVCGATSGKATLVLAFCLGLFAFPLYALSVAHLNDYVEPEDYVEAASGLLLVFAVGAVTGPVLASALIRFASIDSLFAYTASIHAAAAVFTIYRMRERAPAPLEERIAFADALRIAQTVSTVDPRSDVPEDEVAAEQ